jgi:hypothetical protein
MACPAAYTIIIKENNLCQTKTYLSMNIRVTQPENLPFGVNTATELQNMTTYLLTFSTEQSLS